MGAGLPHCPTLSHSKDSQHMAESFPAYGWSGFGNFRRVLGGAAIGGFVGFVAEAKYDDLNLDGLADALAPISLMVIFGLGYVAKDLPERLSFYGPQREAAAFRLVTLLFVVALGTVAAILGYGIWPPERTLCPFLCDATWAVGDTSTVSLFRWSPSDDLGALAVGGLGATLGGFLQMFVVMLRPPLLAPEVVARGLVPRRIVARVLDTAVVWWLVSALLPALWLSRLADEVGLWLYVAVVALVAGAYEFIPALRWGGSLGKRVAGVKLVPIRGSEIPPLRIALRTVMVVVLWSPAAEVLLLAAGVAPLPRWLLETHLGVGILVLVSAAAHSSGQGFHDILPKTMVVPRKQPPAASNGESSPPPTSRSGQVPASRWRPRVFAVGETPFVHDLLDRRGQVEAIAEEILGRPGHGAVMVNGSWGSGKTAFLKMSAAYLRDRGVQVAEFNAWAEQYTRRPLVDLIGAVTTAIPSPRRGDLTRTAALLSDLADKSHGGWQSARGSYRGLESEWDQGRRAVSEFKKALHEIVSDGGQLVVVIDELDRAAPTYALGVLEVVYHLFAVDGVVVLLGVNSKELCHSLQAVYGAEFNAASYLRRLADHRVELGLPGRSEMSRFLDQLLTDLGLADRLATKATTAEILHVVTAIRGCALRDIEQAAHLAAMALGADPPQGHPLEIWEQSIMSMIVLRQADTSAYLQFAAGRIDSLTALAAANASLVRHPAPQSLPPGDRSSLIRFEAVLLNIGTDEQWCDGDRHTTQAFVDRYRRVHRDRSRSGPIVGGSEKDAHRVLQELCTLRSLYTAPDNWAPLGPDEIAARLELHPADSRDL